MCGLVGLVNYSSHSISEQNFRRMIELVKHRGPDSLELFKHNNVRFGHARLSIQDKSEEANQPLSSKDKRYTLIYNGEIYNAGKFKKELEHKGFDFQTESDSEVVLNGLIEWGTNLIPALNGMFAFVFYDSLSKKIIAARDRYGIKPLYYSEIRNCLIFSSEQKSIRAIEGFQTQFNKGALTDYFTFQNMMGDKTLDSQIKVFPPASFVEISTTEKKSLNFQEYWDFEFKSGENYRAKNDELHHLNSLVAESVRKQMIGDKRVGSFLSSGVDSSLIALYASRYSSDLPTFTIGFSGGMSVAEEEEFNENRKAKEFALKNRIDNYQYMVEALDFEKSLQQIVWHLEEPRVGQSFPNYFAAKLASQYVGIVLSGTGADELFGGYPWRYGGMKNVSSKQDFLNKYYKKWHKIIPLERKLQLLKPLGKHENLNTPKESMSQIFKKFSDKIESEEAIFNMNFYFEAKTFLSGLLLVDDKLNMAFGIESRVPFLDNDLVDFALTLPISSKIKTSNSKFAINMDNKETTSPGKIILRNLLSQQSGIDFNQDKKRGFSAPDHTWFRNANRSFIQKKLGSKNDAIYSLIDFNYTQEILNEHFEGHQNHRSLIWSLVYLDTYLEIFA